MKVALVHEYLNQFGGAERVLAVLADIFPKAPIYTLLYDEKASRGLFRGRDVRTSFLQKIPGAAKHHKLYPLLMPLAMEQFDLSGFDLVISVSASFAKGVITKPGTRHICYCLTPPRFLWDNSQRFAREFGFPFFIRGLMPPFISYLRLWDQQASDRVDEYWHISNFVGERIKKYYKRESKLIYPFVDTRKFTVSCLQFTDDNFFLMVGRLVSYKKFDVAIRAFNELGLNLKIIGAGPESGRLKKMAKRNIEFTGPVSDQDLSEYYQQCRALIFPQEEDFGIVPLESMASGRPVIAYRGGGALETVAEGKTGIFFDEPSPESLIAAVQKFQSMNFSAVECRQQAEKFSTDIFKATIIKTLKNI